MRFSLGLWRLPSALGLGVAAATAVPYAAHNPYALLFALIYGAAAVGLAFRNVVTQVLGQGAALALVGAQAHLLFARHPSPVGLALLGYGALAFASGLPFWANQDRFAPLRGKRTFLVGALASTAVAVRLLFLSFDTAVLGGFYFAALGALLTSMLLAQATAVVRMRGWGVLMATASGAACLVPALVWHGAEARLSALAIAASAALVMPLLAARRPSRQRTETGRLAAAEPKLRLEVDSDDEAYETLERESVLVDPSRASTPTLSLDR